MDVVARGITRAREPETERHGKQQYPKQSTGEDSKGSSQVFMFED